MKNIIAIMITMLIILTTGAIAQNHTNETNATNQTQIPQLPEFPMNISQNNQTTNDTNNLTDELTNQSQESILNQTNATLDTTNQTQNNTLVQQSTNITIENQTPQNQNNTFVNRIIVQNASVDLQVQLGFPQGFDYVFVCNTTGFVPTTISWDFGDGQSQSGSGRNVYHIFNQEGQFTVSCIASNGNLSMSDSLQVRVNNNSTQINATGNARLYVKEWYPKQNHFVFVCETPGMTPSRYSWFYGDGHKLIDIRNGDTYHIYEENGTYMVSCSATDGTRIVSDTLVVTVNDIFTQDNTSDEFVCSTRSTDLNGDGRVDYCDIALITQDWDDGQLPGDAASVAQKCETQQTRVIIANIDRRTSMSIALRADFDGDGDVDNNDREMLVENYGDCTDCLQDLNLDGTVDDQDLTIFSRIFPGQQNSTNQSNN